MSSFEISSPATVEEVLSELAADPEGSVLYAGGTELLLAMKQGLVTPHRLIDIKRVAGLRGVDTPTSGGALAIGACTTHGDVVHSELVASRLPILRSVIRRVANARVRSAGTLVGNLCFAEPHSDVSTLAVLLDADVRIEGGGPARWVPVQDFLVDAYETTLRPEELVTSLRMPIPSSETVLGYRRVKGMERPLVTAGVSLTFRDGRIVAARVSIGAVAGTPARPTRAEELLIDVPADSVGEVVSECAYLVAADVGAMTDYEASEEYRRHLCGEMFLRAISDAMAEYEKRVA